MNKNNRRSILLIAVIGILLIIVTFVVSIAYFKF